MLRCGVDRRVLSDNEVMLIELRTFESRPMPH